jgi:hypothetical protein
MRSIKKLHKAVYEPIADLITYRAMPTRTLPMNALDPFIFLNHHGRQEYPAHNNGLPFGPHPHRGFETVTFILEGDLTHKDSSGAESTIRAGGVQWMTAGSGLIHAEVSSDLFKREGGPLEILQLWVNLPARHKMTTPKYTGLQASAIPFAQWDEGRIRANLISGDWHGVEGAFHPLTDIHLASLYFREGGTTRLCVAPEKTVFFYVVKGSFLVHEKTVGMHELVEFNAEGEEILVKAREESILLFGHATPFGEPFTAKGPFVMNTMEEINQAYEDYHAGKFGDVQT